MFVQMFRIMQERWMMQRDAKALGIMIWIDKDYSKLFSLLGENNYINKEITLLKAHGRTSLLLTVCCYYSLSSRIDECVLEISLLRLHLIDRLL